MKMIYSNCIVAFAMMTVVIAFCGCGAVKPLEVTGGGADSSYSVQTSFDAESDNESVETTVSDTVVVYVCGAVKNEGMYELKAGARVGDAIEAAGGMSKDADTEAINLAELVEDGSKIAVVRQGENVDGKMEVSGEEEDGKVNLNTATKEELMGLPGIGEARADAIIAYRENQGGFKAVEDIMNISGIKDAMFSRIKEYIKV